MFTLLTLVRTRALMRIVLRSFPNVAPLSSGRLLFRLTVMLVLLSFVVVRLLSRVRSQLICWVLLMFIIEENLRPLLLIRTFLIILKLIKVIVQFNLLLKKLLWLILQRQMNQMKLIEVMEVLVLVVPSNYP